MKKKFEKPFLMKSELKLNENIALSWEYYNGSYTTTYHFTHQTNSEGSPVNPNESDLGCFGMFTNQLSTGEDGDYGNWFRQSSYTNINSVHVMNIWMEINEENHVTHCSWN